MSLFKEWQEASSQEMTQQQYDAYWRNYLVQEQGNYEKILETKNTSLKGSIKDLAEGFDMDAMTFVGFLDGINSSLNAELNLDSLEADTEIDATIDFEKLYFNMLDAKAEWLYSIDAWGDILTDDKRREIKKEWGRSTMASSEKVGRNDPCPCGSGKKYKKCCLNK